MVFKPSLPTAKSPLALQEYAKMLPCQLTISEKQNTDAFNALNRSLGLAIENAHVKLVKQKQRALKKPVEHAEHAEHAEQKEYLPIEMLFSLYYGLLVPNHSAEVGTEFRQIFAAKQKNESPTLAKTVDYTLFNLKHLHESDSCYLGPKKAALFRLLIYSEMMNQSQWQHVQSEHTPLFKALMKLNAQLRLVPKVQ